ncbi:hypothetical protein FBY35_0694 [Streptomyces sp. SLBN-118]|uniref:hypothetical protein n=1 Tax=Streptomyces sp. SLBN-118 TaxID=2768454 RepID=UPI001168185B|nr:hypothetical protein [Streptomyces sp. SLBN-118]TQK50367.1 hypothetical protein FBY35_0694 [Streptomyces sp. SLBN-118]
MAAVASLVTGVVASLITPSPSAHAAALGESLGLPVAVPTVADGSLEGVDDILPTAE